MCALGERRGDCISRLFWGFSQKSCHSTQVSSRKVTKWLPLVSESQFRLHFKAGIPFSVCVFFGFFLFDCVCDCLGSPLMAAFVIQLQKQPLERVRHTRIWPALSPHPTNSLPPGTVSMPHADSFWLTQVQETSVSLYPLPFPICHSGFRFEIMKCVSTVLPTPHGQSAQCTPEPAWPGQARDAPCRGHSFVGQAQLLTPGHPNSSYQTV